MCLLCQLLSVVKIVRHALWEIVDTIIATNLGYYSISPNLYFQVNCIFSFYKKKVNCIQIICKNKKKINNYECVYEYIYMSESHRWSQERREATDEN